MSATRLILVLLLLAGSAAPGLATPLEDRLRQQLQATTTQLRDLQAAQAPLEAAKASAEKERDALKAKGGSAPKPAASRELAAAKSQNAALGAKASTAAAALVAANARADGLAAQLATAQTELTQAREAVGARNAATARDAAALQLCTDRNARLVATGRELVALHEKRYGRHSFPPLQLLRTRIETEAQAMDDKVAADAIPGPAGATTPR